VVVDGNVLKWKIHGAPADVPGEGAGEQHRIRNIKQFPAAGGKTFSGPRKPMRMQESEDVMNVIEF